MSIGNLSNACYFLICGSVILRHNDDSIIIFRNIVPVKGLNKWFCFAQSTSSGKIIKVFHPSDEKEWIVNFKKSIASAFQANYKNTEVADETDSQSRHKSHYK